LNDTDATIGLAADPKTFDAALDPDLDRLSRRTLLGRAGAGAVGVLAAGIAVASDAQESSQKPRALDDPTLKKAELTRKVSEKQGGDTEVEVYFKGLQVDPPGDHKRAGVIVIHEIFGLTDHIKDVACRFAQAGYTALAPNLFTREGEPPAASAGFQPLMEFVSKVPDHQILGDLKSAISYLKGLPTSNGKVGAVGFCWGGRIVMLLDADAPDLDAAVAYYGRISGKATPNQPLQPLDLADKMHAPLLGNFGAEDQGIPPSEVDKLRAALKEHGKTAELYEYDHAGHAFNNDTRESYRPEAAKLAFHRTLEWFKKYLS
jgi:carboxymethylenebutenolidase